MPRPHTQPLFAFSSAAARCVFLMQQLWHRIAKSAESKKQNALAPALALALALVPFSVKLCK